MARLQPGFAGMNAHMQTSVKTSYIATGEISPGRVVTRVSTNECVQGGSGEILGIAVLDRTLLPSQKGKYVQHDVALVNEFPSVTWAEISTTVASGDPAYYDPATGILKTASAADSSTVRIERATFDTAGVAGEIAVVKLK